MMHQTVGRGLEPEFRKLAAADAALLEAHLLRLSPEDRRLRFCGQVSDRVVRAYCARLDWPHLLVLGCFLGNELRGVAEIFLHHGPHAGEADVALSVEPDFQNRGLGSALMRKVLLLARNRCVGTVYMTCLQENGRMQRIARRFRATLEFEDGSVAGSIWPPWPTYLSVTEEAMIDGRAFFRAVFRTPVSCAG